MSEAERKTRFVIAMFRVLGWPFAVLLVPSALVGIPAAIFKSVTEPDPKVSFPILLATVTAVAVMAFAPVYMLRVAKRMSQRDLSAKTPAAAISVVLLFVAFPIGLFFLLRIANYYEAYCREQLSPI